MFVLVGPVLVLVLACCCMYLLFLVSFILINIVVTIQVTSRCNVKSSLSSLPLGLDWSQWRNPPRQSQFTTASHPSLPCNWMKVKSHFPRTCYEIKTTYLNVNLYEWNQVFVENFLLWVISLFQRRRKLIILSFRASGRLEIKTVQTVRWWHFLFK